METKEPLNAVAAIRVSTTKQGKDGDSPEAQKEQIERFAENKGITIKKFFVFMESASKEQQPMQEAIDYCKNKKNDVNLFIIKSIDRFTRGGSLSYDLLKDQLDKYDVSLVDIYGVISSSKVNTLEHLGVEYKWSVYSPSKKSEILEAERSKDELRDIMSRMIGAEVRYTRMGYWMRQPPYGYASKKVDTPHGKRMILIPEPKESKFIIKLFEMRASGRYKDAEIAEKLNQLGYRGRVRQSYKKGSKYPTNAKQGPLMNERHLWRIARSTIYAGVNTEKWTNGQPVKCTFPGLVSIELFNRANKGKRVIIEGQNDRILIRDREAPEQLTNKGKRNHDFPYKKYVMCPQCDKPLLGSASRGRNGTYYSFYHCDKRGHKFRVTKDELEACVNNFIGDLRIRPERTQAVFEAIEASWERMKQEYESKVENVQMQIVGLQEEASATVAKLKVLSNETAIKYMEEDLVRIEKSIEELQDKKTDLESKKPGDIKTILARAKYFVENLDKLLVKQIDPVKKAQFFGVIFDKVPNYEELKSRNTKIPLLPGVNPLFATICNENSRLVIPAGIEPAIFRMKT